MRLPLIAITLLLAATPTLAGAREPGRIDVGTAARALSEPTAQDALARTIDQLAGIVLDTRVGSLAALMDPSDDIRPDDTLRSVRERDDPNFERRLHQNTRRVLAVAGSVAGATVNQTAELRRTAERLEEVLRPLISMAARDH